MYVTNILKKRLSLTRSLLRHSLRKLFTKKTVEWNKSEPTESLGWIPSFCASFALLVSVRTGSATHAKDNPNRDQRSPVVTIYVCKGSAHINSPRPACTMCKWCGNTFSNSFRHAANSFSRGSARVGSLVKCICYRRPKSCWGGGTGRVQPGGRYIMTE